MLSAYFNVDMVIHTKQASGMFYSYCIISRLSELLGKRISHRKDVDYGKRG